MTGGAGFIGVAVIRQLIAHTGHTVLNLDNLTYAGNLLSLATISRSSRYSFKKCDINDRKQVDTVLAEFKPDIVMHLAAESHVDRSIVAPDAFIQTNLVGTYQLLEACRCYWQKLDPKRRSLFKFHHISTDEVYGDLEDYADRCSEEARYAPSSPYSASKAGSDHLVRSWHRTFGLPVVITNCSNNFGPNQFPEKLIPQTIIRAISGQKIPIYGDGNQIRDCLFVDDHARALIVVALEGAIGQSYNIGADNERTNLEVVNMICSLLQELKSPERSPSLKYSELIDFVEDRPGHDKRYALDARKIKQRLGWRPLETFESGLHKTVKWYLKNEHWWRAILDGSYRESQLLEQ